MIQPIETSYRGYRFRSRTEARWAVAMDVAEIRYEYEPEGYALASGWYLPDFWLPERKHWLEVKGSSPTQREEALARELANSGPVVLIAVGAPDPHRLYLKMFDGGPDEYEMMFDLPSAAYVAARSERFDGKPHTSPGKRPVPRWW